MWDPAALKTPLKINAVLVKEGEGDDGGEAGGLVVAIDEAPYGSIGPQDPLGFALGPWPESSPLGLNTRLLEQWEAEDEDEKLATPPSSPPRLDDNTPEAAAASTRSLIRFLSCPYFKRSTQLHERSRRRR